MVSSFYRCEAEITFSEEIVSVKTGRMIPLDPYTMGRHQCPMYKPPRNYVPCRMCGMLLYFDPDAPKSVNDKWVPYEQKSGEPHQCPESDYNKKNSGPDRTEIIKASLAKMRAAKQQYDDEDLEEILQGRSA